MDVLFGLGCFVAAYFIVGGILTVLMWVDAGQPGWQWRMWALSFVFSPLVLLELGISGLRKRIKPREQSE